MRKHYIDIICVLRGLICKVVNFAKSERDVSKRRASLLNYEIFALRRASVRDRAIEWFHQFRNIIVSVETSEGRRFSKWANLHGGFYDRSYNFSRSRARDNGLKRPWLVLLEEKLMMMLIFRSHHIVPKLCRSTLSSLKARRVRVDDAPVVELSRRCSKVEDLDYRRDLLARRIIRESEI